jgi:hypothetical protein
MPFMRLEKTQLKSLELEVVPGGARLELTRIIRSKCLILDGDDGGISLLQENEFVNIANQVMGKPIYVLEGGDWGEYHHAEHAWHHGQREYIMRVPSTAQLAEILADYLQRGMMGIADVNGILKRYNCGFRFKNLTPHDAPNIAIEITATESIPEADLSKDHPNVRKLASRMDYAFEQKDYPAVLHASASIFETLAKEVINKPTVANETLGGIFEGYKKKSLLPVPILDYILEIYNARNKTPLAGHGSLASPTLDAKEAVVLCEFTKSVVRMERSLAEQKVDLTKSQPSKAGISSAQTTPAIPPVPPPPSGPPTSTASAKPTSPGGKKKKKPVDNSAM